MDQAVVKYAWKTVTKLTPPTWSKTNHASISYIILVYGGRVIDMLLTEYGRVGSD